MEAPIKIEGDYGFIAIGYKLDPKSKVEQDIKWEVPYGVLDPGKYRVVKDVSILRDIDNYDDINFVVEFSIK